MGAEIGQLEKDMQKAARDMAGTQPGATGRVREALSELQQNEVKGRTESSAQYIRQGMGGYMITREAPVTQALDKVAEDLKAAQNALGQGGKQASNDTERSLGQVERIRSAMEQMAGKGQNGQQPGQQQGSQQGGQQQGGQPNGQSGGQQGGQQQGRQQGRQPGTGAIGGQFGAYGLPGDPNGGGQWGNRYYNGRFPPEGSYEPLDPRSVDPKQVIQAATRELNDMRQMFKDNPDLTRELGDVEREISRLAVGDISSAELQNRLNHEVLPNLESLESQLRRQVEQQNGDVVRSGSTDKIPAGYAAAVEEYFRKLSKGKP